MMENEEKIFAFKCKICPDYMANSEINLTNHHKSHQNQEFMCKICSSPFIYKAFILHLTIVHNLKPEEILLQLGITNRTKIESAYKCKICPRSFDSYTNLADHGKLHEKSTISCEYCGKYLQECDLEWHVDNLHTKTNLLELTQNSDQQSMVEDEDDKSIEISRSKVKDKEKKNTQNEGKDSRKCSSGKNKKQKPNKEEEISEFLSIEVMDADNYEEEDDMKEEKQKFNCDMCGDNFPNYRKYYLHAQKFHASELKDKSLSDHQNLKYEMYECEICGKLFSHYKQYQNHLRIHNKTIKCTVCPLMFRTKYDMNKHFTVHEKGLYPCTICGKNYKLMGKHMQEEHGLSYQENENPFKEEAAVDIVAEDTTEVVYEENEIEYLMEDVEEIPTEYYE